MSSRVRVCVRIRPELVAFALIALAGLPQQKAGAQEVPEHNRKEMAEALGPPFIVFRDKVLEELKVSDEQREKLMQYALEQLMETGPFLDSLKDTEAPERDKKLEEHRKAALEKLTKHEKEVLKPEQLTRVRQVVLQQEGGFALGQEEVRKELKITQEQVMKFMAIVHDLQNTVQGLVKQAQAGGNPEEIRPKVMQARKDHAKQLEGVLSEDQKKQWKEMLGPPFELGD
jgi:hypothetical protein